LIHLLELTRSRTINPLAGTKPAAFPGQCSDQLSDRDHAVVKL
jgi:hypothetical protein